jgi:hypothetical protein
MTTKAKAKAKTTKRSRRAKRDPHPRFLEATARLRAVTVELDAILDIALDIDGLGMGEDGDGGEEAEGWRDTIQHSLNVLSPLLVDRKTRDAHYVRTVATLLADDSKWSTPFRALVLAYAQAASYDTTDAGYVWVDQPERSAS